MKRCLVSLGLIVMISLLLCFATAENPKISCSFVFEEETAQIGKPFSFSYSLSGGSGSFSNLIVGASFFSVHNNTGGNVDNQIIELGTAPSGVVTFIPKTGTSVSFDLQGEDAVTHQSFYFACQRVWLPIQPNPNHPVSFTFDKASYSLGESITVNYHIANLNNEIVDGKLWWLVVTEFGMQTYFKVTNIVDPTGSVEITPSFGTCIYAVLEGEDDAGNPIYAESEHISFESKEEISYIFVLPESLQIVEEEAFLGTAVQEVIMPSGLSIWNIDFNAFQDTPLKVVYGNSEDARTFALEHGISYIPIE